MASAEGINKAAENGDAKWAFLLKIILLEREGEYYYRQPCTRMA